MTMPHERTRSFLWGHALLTEMLQDESIDDSIRAIAGRLIATYPHPDQLLKLIEDNAHALPRDAADALVAAGNLWTKLQQSQQGTAATRHSLLYTQRHFPEAWIAESLGREPLDGLRSWLRPEDHDYSSKA